MSASPYRGTSELTLDRDLIRAIYDTRVVIEEAAVRRAVSRLTETDFAALERHLEALGEAVAAGDQFRASQEDLAFHTLLYERAEQPVLLEMWAVIKWRIRFFLVQYRVSTRPSPLQARERHLPLLFALRSRDVEAAAAAAREHVVSGSLLEVIAMLPLRRSADQAARTERRTPPAAAAAAAAAAARVPSRRGGRDRALLVRRR